MNLITRLRLVFTHLSEYKYRYTLNPIYSCRESIEIIIQYLLYCPTYLNQRTTLLSNRLEITFNMFDTKRFESIFCAISTDGPRQFKLDQTFFFHFIYHFLLYVILVLYSIFLSKWLLFTFFFWTYMPWQPIVASNFK